MIHRTLWLSSLILLVSSASAFTPSSTASSSRSSPSTVLYGGGKGMASSPAGKKTTVELVQNLLTDSEMIFTIPASSLTVAETEKLRRSMPETTTIKVVKNTLMQRAIEGTPYADATDRFLTGANMWFFIQDDISATMSAYNGFCKDAGKKETHAILGGVTEGTAYDTLGVEAIGKLPSKQDLYAKIAGSIQAVPTKVARVIKAPSNKLARAIKLAAEEGKKE